MYVVRRTFRNYGQMMVPGSVVEPGSIKRFKSRLNDGNIVEVTEQNFDKWDEYFKVRIGVAIQKPVTEVAQTETKVEAKTIEAAKPAAKPLQPTPAKAVVKPASK